MKDFYAVIEERSSCRSFLAEPIADAVLLRMLTAANLSPSAHNTQPWHFCAVTSAEQKRRLFERAGEAFFHDLVDSGVSRAEARERAYASERFFCNIPALVIVFAEYAQGQSIEALAKQNDSLVGVDKASCQAAQIEQTLRLQSASVAAAQLLFAAQAEELGACWYCLPLYCPEVFRTFAGLSVCFCPVALIALGRRAAKAERREKRPLTEKMSVF